MATTFKVPLLYRHILKAAKDFPSKKRAGIIQDIKITFHENKVGTLRPRSSSCLFHKCGFAYMWLMSMPGGIVHLMALLAVFLLYVFDKKPCGSLFLCLT